MADPGNLEGWKAIPSDKANITNVAAKKCFILQDSYLLSQRLFLSFVAIDAMSTQSRRVQWSRRFSWAFMRAEFSCLCLSQGIFLDTSMFQWQVVIMRLSPTWAFICMISSRKHCCWDKKVGRRWSLSFVKTLQCHLRDNSNDRANFYVARKRAWFLYCLERSIDQSING